MSFAVIYSRSFLTKVHDWSEDLRNMVMAAAAHAALNPDLNDYKRDYLTPYRQKHPPTDRQYCLFFTVHSSTHIFIAWINDSTCLHDTRANYPDPCRKQFERLRDSGQLETYDSQYHVLQFEVKPDPAKPIRCRSSFLGYNIFMNSYSVGNLEFIGHAFVCDDPILGIAKLHTQKFLSALCEHLNQKQIQFKLQFTKVGHEHEIDLLQTYNPVQWRIVDDPEDFILEKL